MDKIIRKKDSCIKVETRELGVKSARGQDLEYYSSQNFTVAINPRGLLRYHSIILPHRSINSITELNNSERMELSELYGLVTPLLVKFADGAKENESRSYITALQTGYYEGRPSERFHIHLIPRSYADAYSGDHDRIYVDLYENGHVERSLEDAESMANALRSSLEVYLRVRRNSGEINNTPRIRGTDNFCVGYMNDMILLDTGAFYLAYNHKPIVNGHSLIISRDHVRGLLDLRPEEVKELYYMIDKAVTTLLDAYDTDAYDLKIRSGNKSGRTQDHFHIHIIPRPRTRDGMYEKYYVDQEIRREARSKDEIVGEYNRLRELFRR